MVHGPETEAQATAQGLQAAMGLQGRSVSEDEEMPGQTGFAEYFPLQRKIYRQ